MSTIYCAMCIMFQSRTRGVTTSQTIDIRMQTLAKIATYRMNKYRKTGIVNHTYCSTFVNNIVEYSGENSTYCIRFGSVCALLFPERFCAEETIWVFVICRRFVFCSVQCAPEPALHRLFGAPFALSACTHNVLYALVFRPFCRFYAAAFLAMSLYPIDLFVLYTVDLKFVCVLVSELTLCVCVCAGKRDTKMVRV